MTENGWSWWAAEVDSPEDDPEIYGINEPTRDGAIAAARRDFGPHAHIVLVEATQDGPFNARPFDEDGECCRLDFVIERFSDMNGERWGEGDGPTSLPMDELAKAMNDAFERVICENHDAVMEGAWSFTGTRNKEWLPPE